METGDLDVVVEVDDTHIRLLSGEESLGSWCLADVRAHRVVANEFEIDLQSETVRFLADDQVNFAYGAVQGMAEAWARYHSMNLVRRGRAVSSARKLNEPSRLQEAARAFEMARADLVSDRFEELAPMPAPAPIESTAPTSPPISGDSERAPGGFWQKVEEARRHGENPQTRSDMADSDMADSDEVDADEVRAEESGGRHEVTHVTSTRLPRFDAFGPTPQAPSSQDPVESGDDVDRVVDEPTPMTAEPEHKPEVANSPEEVEGDSLVDGVPAPTKEPAPVPGPAQSRSTSSEPSNGQVTETGESPRTEGIYFKPRVEGEGVAEMAPARSDVPAYAGGRHPAETSGLRASLRSMMGRSKPDPHEHTFVESTTAVGLTRKVCIECGHVSIGVS